ncbi:MAG: hypothetical protein D3910_00785 [Candidatus Electrothrix sp. ATG2]|nr:hypothetical protein [Candidatus Electrothrix sp. ATG2]
MVLICVSLCDFDFSKQDVVNKLNEKTAARRTIYGLVSLLIIFIVLAVTGTFLRHEIIDNPTTFNVSVKTEEVKVNTYDVPMSDWPVHNIQLSQSCPDDLEDITLMPFSGTLKIYPSVEIILTRIASGDLHVTLRNGAGKPSGMIVDDEDEELGELSDCAFFHMRKIADRTQSGETIVLPITGNIKVGREIRFLSHYETPVLRSGSIALLDKTFLIGENYSVGPFVLKTGDLFEIQSPSVPSQGFALIDTNPGIQLIYRGNGHRGVSKRYQSEDYVIRNSVWSKLYNDTTLPILWMLIVIIFSSIRIILRLIVSQ